MEAAGTGRDTRHGAAGNERAYGVAVPERHDLVWLTAEGWNRFADREPGLMAIPGMALWPQEDFPVMVRRRQPADDAGRWPVAVALPAAFGRARLGFQIEARDVAAVSAPPSWLEAASSLPEPWRSRGEATGAMGAGIGLQPRVFGSAMWQHLTGMTFLRPASDLDLLWKVRGGPGAGELACRLASGLERLNRDPGPRLDGEVVLAGRGVQWRELLRGGADELLVKSVDEVMLMPVRQFLSAGAA
ncbi:malonate decarboxylase holo-[acyl-carrier-protein] synthase [Rhizosaccharibacter radicis]|uniref:Malonate decarboxylase holo-[acyl-carrier-protein] synthase n=1 Tax=Rhizosaccharibacter radicis TaxID=2782605 RepID=A0ABT1W2S9_9PROT|nr:malonate decarboxylase holo-[acyl-carrier-protein] synthase [Acetobacteraceae bacterium KSS12]